MAVILAGGTGQRVGLPVPKQLLKIAGKSIIEHTLAVFEAAPGIDEIVILMAQGYVPEVEEIVAKAGFRKVSQVLEGGATRNETTTRALAALGDDECKVLFHDAVRPLVSQRVIADCVTALDNYDAVDVAIPSADTIIVVDEDRIKDVPARAMLRRGQTPQGFRLSTIRKAYELALVDPDFAATDDCTVVLRYLPDVPIYVVQGEDSNMKVTEPVDIFLADKLFQLASQVAPSHADPDAYTTALSGKSMVIFGGSYGIGADIVRLAEAHGATVHSFSRSTTGTHAERPEDVEAALEQAFRAAGRIDYVVNCAGVLQPCRIADADYAAVEESLRVNYLAPVVIAKSAFPYLQATQGQLLLYTSSSYTRGRAEYSLYSSAKAAVVNLTQALADEWSEDRVRINCINPERTRTPMRTKAFGDEPAHTLLSSEEVARTSLDVLISAMTGHVIDVLRQDPGRFRDLAIVDDAEEGKP